MQSKSYGLVLCGGQSVRMGQEKGFITYHEKPQCYHMHEMLDRLCEKTFISHNPLQQEKFENKYSVLIDLPNYTSIGPMAALLSAYTKYPNQDFILVGCDYPFVESEDLKRLLNSSENEPMASAYYHEEEQIYEPVLAWYSHRAAQILVKQFETRQYSLQYFLQSLDAVKLYPSHLLTLRSVDTTERMTEAKAILKIKLENR